MNKILLSRLVKKYLLYTASFICIIILISLFRYSFPMATISYSEIINWQLDGYKPWYYVITGYNGSYIFLLGWLMIILAFGLLVSSINLFFKAEGIK